MRQIGKKSLIMLVGLSLVIQCFVANAQTSQVGEKLWEKNFDDDIVEIVPSEEGEPFPIKAVISKKQVNFFDDKGTVRREIVLNKYGNAVYVKVTQRNKVLIENRKSDYEHDVTMLNEDGSTAWTKKDLGNIPYVSGNGKYVVTGKALAGEDGHNEVVSYDETGNVKWKYSIRRPTDFQMHVLYNGRVLLYEMGKIERKLRLLDIDGKELWSYLFSESDLQDMFFTSTVFEKGNTIICRSADTKKIYGFSEEGKLIWDSAQPVQVQKISKEGNYLFGIVLTVSENYAFSIDMKTGKKLWSNKDIEGESIDISADGSLILVSGEPARIKNQLNLYLLDAVNGTIVKKIKADETSIYGKLIKDKLAIIKDNKKSIQLFNR